ncbi:hypothetical protein DID88_005652 [Monilinia fructigena]|uniref:Uncharacterized protein n=1 Tax=Monilinia fructigena TaxID=38457 RepID=A0A395J0S1_9HELO|nr:hypothetical protein DID88_005652 [Monilinia fructigena]
MNISIQETRIWMRKSGSYQESATTQPGFPDDFGLPGQNFGFADEHFADVSLDLGATTFDNLMNDFPSEQNGGDVSPDWIELVKIVDQHDNLDTEMLDVDTCQLKDSALIIRVDSFQSMPSENSQSQEIDIVVSILLPKRSYVSNTPSSYQEGVFSSTPGLSSVPTNYGSSLGEWVHLDSVTRAKANAVKAIGACWRCKFLRKPCDAQTCCSRCMGKHSGVMQVLGAIN